MYFGDEGEPTQESVDDLLHEMRHDGKSTGLFEDEEDLNEVKYKLKVDAPEPDFGGNEPDFGDEGGDEPDFGDEGGDEPDFGDEGGDDKPFDDSGFDAGIDVDEDEDPKKFIEKLSGKIGQSLRQYTKDEGETDVELEKFVINSVISATHTGEMGEDDQQDIIDKVKSAGVGGNDEPEGDNEPEEPSDTEDIGNEDEGDNSEGDVEENFQLMEDNNPCWGGYEMVGMKKKGGVEVPNCVPIKEVIQEAEYQGNTVKLNKPMRGDIKKYKVYVKNDKGNVVKVNFGDKNMEIKRDDPERRKSFRARHKCDTPSPKWKAKYWSCKFWSTKSVTDLLGESGENFDLTENFSIFDAKDKKALKIKTMLRENASMDLASILDGAYHETNEHHGQDYSNYGNYDNDEYMIMDDTEVAPEVKPDVRPDVRPDKVPVEKQPWKVRPNVTPKPKAIRKNGE